MSYKNLNKSDDSLNILFTRLADFNSISHNLLDAESIDVFEVWFEKLHAIDARTLYFFLCKYFDSFPEEYIKRAQLSYKKEIKRENAID